MSYIFRKSCSTNSVFGPLALARMVLSIHASPLVHIYEISIIGNLLINFFYIWHSDT